MAITNSEIKAVLKEVEDDLRKAYEEETKKLAKADGEESKDAPPVSAPEASDSSAAPAESAPADAIPSTAESAAPSDMSAPESAPASAPAAAPEAGTDPAADSAPGLTPEALQAEYGALAPEELDMHIKAALAAKAAVAAAQAPAPAAPDMSAAPASPEMGMPPGAPAMKGEISANGGKEVPVKKSEPDLEVIALKAQLAEQKAELEIVTKSLTTFLERPIRKSVAAISELGKAAEAPKSYSRADVMKLVGENAGKLTKSERDLYLDFADGKVEAKKLVPILERITQK